MALNKAIPREVKEIQEICDTAVDIGPRPLMIFDLVPDHFKTEEICNDIMRINPAAIFLIPKRFRTKEMCEKAVEEDSRIMRYVLINLKLKGCVLRQLRKTYTC